MTPIMLFTTALRALRYHKIRTVLTMLGIIIGIAALITTMAIGRGAQKKIEAEISALGDNCIVLYAGTHVKNRNASRRNRATQAMNLRDMFSLKKQIPLIKHISPMSDQSKFIASFGTTNVEVNLKGANEHWLSISSRKLAAGRNMTSEDYALAKRVVILGSEAAESLFKHSSPVGQHILLGSRKFYVIGVLKKIDSHDPMATPNLNIVVPYTAAQKLAAKKHIEFPDYFFISCRDPESIPVVVRQMSNIMKARHHLKQQDAADFTIFDQQSYGKAKARSSDILSILLLIIASISLLVGGIGVMNIMLVSVSERTREIGVRMALGATSSIILLQFVIESIVICCIGGICGIITGIATPMLIGSLAKWPISIAPMSVVVASTITMLVGIFFGIYPAHKASQLKPVEALQEQ